MTLHPNRAFSMVEIVVATAILAMAFVPIVTQSQQTVREAGVSQEEILARHYLMDMVERFKGSPVGELKDFPAAEPPIALGEANEQFRIRRDAMLSDTERIAADMERMAGMTGLVDAGERGVTFFLAMARALKLTRVVTFERLRPPSPVAPGMYRLTCIVRWKSKVTKGEKRVEFSKLLVRQ